LAGGAPVVLEPVVEVPVVPLLDPLLEPVEPLVPELSTDVEPPVVVPALPLVDSPALVETFPVLLAEPVVCPPLVGSW
jgi:hypothetical protein